MPDEQRRRLEYLDLDVLRFDPENPRLPSGRSSEPSEVLSYLLESANLLDLMRSIGAQDFFPGEPLLVTDDGHGTYTVVEGNRRYAACRLLSHPEEAPIRKRSVDAVVAQAEFFPSSLPCLVLPAAEITGFLGYRHITGIQEWSPVAKARYLLQLWNGDEGPVDREGRLRWIAKRIGSRSDYVARLLTSIALFAHIDDQNYYGIEGLDEESLSFSLLALAMNRPDLASYIGLADGQDFELDGLRKRRLQRLVRWFFEKDSEGRTLLGESRNMSMLVSVVKHPEARAALEGGATLARAFRLTEAPSVALGQNLQQAMEALDAVLGLLTAGTRPVETDAETARTVSGLSRQVVTKFEALLA